MTLKLVFIMKKLLFLLLLLPLFAAAQYDSTKPLQYQNAYGFNWKNAKFRNSLVLPHDTIQMAVADSGAIVWNSGGVYVWDGYVWGLSSGAGTDSSAFRFAEQLSDTSFAIKSLLDSVTFIFEVEGAGFDIDSINAALSGKLNITDTTGKWATGAVLRNDSLFLVIGGEEVFFGEISAGGDSNIYKTDGTLMGNRAVAGDGNSFQITGLSSFKIEAEDSVIVKGVMPGSMGGRNKVLLKDSVTDALYEALAQEIVFDTSDFVINTDTVRVKPEKFPLFKDDSLRIKYPPNAVAVNLTGDTSEVQFVKVKRKLIGVLSDTVRWTGSGALPSGSAEIYYRWSQFGSNVNLQIWAYYPTSGVGVSGASINLPSDCPAPNYPTGWNIAGGIIAEGSGGLYVNRSRDMIELPASGASCTLKRKADDSGWELVNKMGSGSYRVSHWNINYETTDY